MNKLVNVTLTSKQGEAFSILENAEGGIELVYGGGARGGKSWFGSFWTAQACERYPGSQWLIGREELKALKRTTMRTFFKVLSEEFGMKKGVDYVFNAQDMIVTFIKTKSVVFFAELKTLPSDPEFDRLGSYDLTGYWVDEAQEVSKGAKDTLQFRCSLLSGPGWETDAKALYTCNPRKTWIHSEFWKPLIKDKLIVPGKAFVTALFSDNPFIDRDKYRRNVLKTKNKIKIQRLLYGNFEYDDNPYKIFSYDRVLDMFSLITDPVTSNSHKYITCDVARLGRDKTYIILWHGLQIKRKIRIDKSGIDVVMSKIKDLANAEGVPFSNIIADEDGVGGGVIDGLKGIKGFTNNASALQPKRAEHDKTVKVNYANLKTQCYFKLADLVNDSKIGIDPDVFTDDEKEMLVEELDVISQVDADKDKTLRITSKETVKELLGRSPDISDAIMMRMYFEVVPKTTVAFISIG